MSPVRLALFCLALATSTPAAAQVRPTPGAGDPRVQSVVYNPQQTVQLSVADGYQLTVELGQGEKVENIAVGDSASWQVTPNRRGDHLFIKPVGRASPTNMTVITDARSYSFELMPAYSSFESAFTVRFSYPQADSVAQATPLPEDVEGRYRLSGSKSVRPTAISDDGVHTYLIFGKNQSLPAIYARDDDGTERPVEGAMRDGRFVIDAVAEQLVFRRDRRFASAVRKIVRKDDR